MWPRGDSSPPSAYAWHARDSGAPVWPVGNVEMPQGPLDLEKESTRILIQANTK